MIPIPKDESSLRRFPLRVGRHLGRTLYFRNGGDDWRKDTEIGMVDTPELGQAIVRAVNAYYGHEEN